MSRTSTPGGDVAATPAKRIKATGQNQLMGENASGEALAGGRGGAFLVARYERSSTYLVTNQSRRIPMIITNARPR